MRSHFIAQAILGFLAIGLLIACGSKRMPQLAFSQSAVNQSKVMPVIMDLGKPDVSPVRD